jgi:hypothetical protein
MESFKVRFKLDLTYIDEEYSHIRKHNRKNPIGEPIEIEGTLEEIKTAINEKLDSIGEFLEHYKSGKEDEINVG